MVSDHNNGNPNYDTCLIAFEYIQAQWHVFSFPPSSLGILFRLWSNTRSRHGPWVHGNAMWRPLWPSESPSPCVHQLSLLFLSSVSPASGWHLQASATVPDCLANSSLWFWGLSLGLDLLGKHSSLSYLCFHQLWGPDKLFPWTDHLLVSSLKIEGIVALPPGVAGKIKWSWGGIKWVNMSFTSQKQAQHVWSTWRCQ